MPKSQGCKYVLTVIDRFTRWPEAIPLRDIDTMSIDRAYLQNWVARYGVPAVMTSDRGPQFVSDLWKSLSKLLGTELIATTAYHPKANGLVERLHRSMKASLRARLTGPDWTDQIPWVMLGLRTAPKEDLDASPAELVYGSTLTVPGNFIQRSLQVKVDEHLRQLQEKVDTLKPTPTSAHGAEKTRYRVPDSLSTAKYVHVRRDGKKTPLQTPYEGSYKALHRTSKFFRLQVGAREETVSIDRLKSARVDEEVPIQVAVPPRCGLAPTNDQPIRPRNQGPASGIPSNTFPPSTDWENSQGAANSTKSSSKAKTSPPMATNSPVPTYTEATTRAGRTTKSPQWYRDETT